MFSNTITCSVPIGFSFVVPLYRTLWVHILLLVPQLSVKTYVYCFSGYTSLLSSGLASTNALR